MTMSSPAPPFLPAGAAELFPEPAAARRGRGSRRRRGVRRDHLLRGDREDAGLLLELRRLARGQLRGEAVVRVGVVVDLGRAADLLRGRRRAAQRDTRRTSSPPQSSDRSSGPWPASSPPDRPCRLRRRRRALEHLDDVCLRRCAGVSTRGRYREHQCRQYRERAERAPRSESHVCLSPVSSRKPPDWTAHTSPSAWIVLAIRNGRKARFGPRKRWRPAAAGLHHDTADPPSASRPSPRPPRPACRPG